MTTSSVLLKVGGIIFDQDNLVGVSKVESSGFTIILKGGHLFEYPSSHGDCQELYKRLQSHLEHQGAVK